MTRPRRRPLAVRWFVVLFLLSALLAFFEGMRDLDRTGLYLARHLPGIDFDRDTVIVLLSARLSIALIPTALLWFLASNFARWMVTALALLKLAGVPGALAGIAEGETLSAWWAASTLLGVMAVGLLFTRASRSYFARHEPIGHAV